MKSNIQPNFYFSAYPLKALNLPEEEQNNYLHIYSKSDGHIKNPGRSKVLPMIHPYKKSEIDQAAGKKNQTDTIVERDTEWFANYE